MVGLLKRMETQTQKIKLTRNRYALVDREDHEWPPILKMPLTEVLKEQRAWKKPLGIITIDGGQK